ncbi:sulfotransferase 1C1-like isoform X2 [Rhinoderma darwinii]|uniref:sulfotransferase 1C1-like isoform X2 n=1 Tax=Rhinoderma darwinii TaxID=43563 RepID=UPI003F674FD7
MGNKYILWLFVLAGNCSFSPAGESQVVSPSDYTKSLQEVPDGTFYRFPLLLVHGVPLMLPIATSWEKIEKFQARPDDLLIATYPKAGTTWMQEIVDSIMNEGEVEKTRRAPTHIRSPFLEICSPPPVPSGIDLLDVTPSPRLVKTHLPYKLVPTSFWQQKCKVIYVARNAKDNAVSYYFFDRMNKTQPEPGTWDEYVEKFLEGDVGWGSWFDHVLGWWKARDHHDILYMFYEDMKEDPKREIRKTMKFLGKDLSEEAVERIYQHTSFNAMKENPMANYSSIPTAVLDQSLSPFMRKGEVADWMNHFTESHNKIFDKEYRRRMEGSNLEFRCSI